MDEVRRVDVVVVGSGVSGSAAAMTAARGGAKVALLEKQAEFGGSAALSAGMFWTAPSVDAYRKRIPLGNVDLGGRLVGDYEEALAELRAAGVRVAEEPKRDIMTFGIGYSTDIHGILAWCRDQVLAAGGETAAGAVVTELVRDGRAVTGVLVRTAAGRRIRYEAGAVVLASGGFQGDRDELTRLHRTRTPTGCCCAPTPAASATDCAWRAPQARRDDGDEHVLRAPAAVSGQPVRDRGLPARTRSTTPAPRCW